MIENVRFIDADHTAVVATIDGVIMTAPLDSNCYAGEKLVRWIEQGNEPAPYAIPADPAPE